MEQEELKEKHSFIRDSLFRSKMLALSGIRLYKNLKAPLPKFQDDNQLCNAPILAISESELWNPNDNAKNWILTAGKIENLRIASQLLDGIEVKANQVFSFWKHLGNPNFGKGYVIGREIREGCVVPTIAGGLCQLSNALYDAALKANLDIVERHRHTKVIKGSLAEKDRDATVKWNYIDLRFKAPFDFRIEVKLTADKLIVSFKSAEASVESNAKRTALRHSSLINDCYSCGNVACFKHPKQEPEKAETASSCFILDERWPEFDQYIQSIKRESDSFILPLAPNKVVSSDRYKWRAAQNHKKTRYNSLASIARAVQLRRAAKYGSSNIFELQLKWDQKLARKAAAKIPIDSQHLVISQNLLPFLYKSGALGGGTYDVLMTRLPMESLHAKLDRAFAKHPGSPTLKDFRAPSYLIDWENKALNRARKIISPHQEIVNLFSAKASPLNWQHDPIATDKPKGRKILFPASALGRKGAYEMKEIASELNLEFMVSGRSIEAANFWDGLNTQSFDGDYDQIGLIIYPTYIEHQPRTILKAIAKGIPIITTTACGIKASEQVQVLSAGDRAGLLHAVQGYLNT
ncbi:VanW family protein [Croceimicrobium hydrocarbonivorans]|uniref:VanW family protein n=1 Tax=Croceimicrobium hydrocarbonivorans TaxID=2761580 RepID=A0A7H0VDQ1_9FLAO|nr:VanW family protein [Croceimicrobium hydrocarbonivorans]QNR23849.1 VanW family protein [Croceimicrobium hydrocarbonivorans]